MSTLLRVWLWVAMVGLGLGIAGCEDRSAGPRGSTKAPGDPPVLVTSIFPLQDLTRQLAGSFAQVHSLMPPGSNPHDFEPNAQQIALLEKADAVIVVGLNLDTWATRLAVDRKIPVITMAELSPLKQLPALPAKDEHEDHAGHDHHGHDHHDHGHGTINQHLWLDVPTTQGFVGNLARRLTDLYPAHAAALAQNQAKLEGELKALHEELTALLGPLPVKEMVTFHNAFDLLAARYGLKVVAHLAEIELAPGGEIRPADLAQAIDAIQDHKLTVLYAEPQFPSKAVRMIAEQTGVKVLTLDPEGNPNVKGYDSYQNLLRSNAKVLAEGQARVK